MPGLVLLWGVVPLVLSNNPAGAACSGLILVAFFFCGYLFSVFVGTVPAIVRFAISPVLGILCLTTAYDVFARASLGTGFLYFAGSLTVAGVILFARRVSDDLASWSAEDSRAVLAG